MKKYLFTIALAALVVLPNSCTKSEVRPSDGQQPTPDTYNGELAMMSFQAVTEAVSSKTSLTIEGETASVSWASGDAVKFIYEIDKAPSYAESSALTASDINGGQATFSASVPADFALSNGDFTGSSRHLYAVYPSTVAHDYSNASTFYVTVPSVQDGSFANASIALAKWQQDSPTAPLVFKNLCGLLQVVVSDADVRKIVLSSDAVIAGKVSVTFPDDATPGVKAVSAGETEITVNVPGAGTYYVAVLPAEITNLYFALYDGSDNLIGDKMSGNTLSVARKQIRKLGTLATGFADRMYFTPDGQGTKDGSSWDNAGDATTLFNTMKSSTVINKSLYLAAGDYTFTGAVKPATGTSLKLYGGFPADATGYSLAGRNVSGNVSRIYNGTTRIFWTQSGNWLFDGLTFTSTGYASDKASGCALLLLAGTESATVNNCTFTGCTHAGTLGGAVRVAVPATFTNCTFTGNSATAGQGGALYVIATGDLTMSNCKFNSNSAATHGGALVVDGGKVTANDCDFESNTATTSAGAIYTLNAAVVKLNRCTFRTNKANGSNNSDGGGAIWATGTSKLYLNRCFLANNQDNYNAHHIYSGTSSYVGINNSVIRGPYGVTKTQGSLLQIKGYNVIVNSTLISQTGSWGTVSLGSKDADGCRIINDIVINCSSSQYAFYATSYYMQLYNTIYSVVKNATENYGATDPESSCVAGASMRSGGNFPTTALEWGYAGSTISNGDIYYYDDAHTRYAYYYPWVGTTDAGTVVKNSLANIKTLISGTTNIGPDFLTWLESDELKVNGREALAVDIRGEARNSSAMWPGSYEQANAVASAPAFNLR